jgi:hypothetical protein
VISERQDMSQSTQSPLYKRNVRSFFLAFCLLHLANSVHAAEDLITIQHRAEQGDTNAQFSLGV